jgi:hypothetical protein
MVQTHKGNSIDTGDLIDEGVASAYHAAVFRLGSEDFASKEVNRMADVLADTFQGEGCDVTALALHFLLCQLLGVSVDYGKVQ